jgi:phage shock protein A
MIDPGTVISVLDLVKVVVQRLVEASRTMHDAPQSLAEVINEAARLEALLDRLLIFQRALPPEQQDILDRQVSSAGCLKLLKDLDDLTSGRMSGGKDGDGTEEKMKLAQRWWWLRKKDVVEDLVKKLEDELENLSKRLVK